MKNQAQNTFGDGLMTDFHPLSCKNTVMTDALNATIVTTRGNEMVLQNDLGNEKIIGKNPTYLKDGQVIYNDVPVKLTDGYIPIGVKEYQGIIYIVSYNPQADSNQKYPCEIGCYPSPNYAKLAQGENTTNMLQIYQPLKNLVISKTANTGSNTTTTDTTSNTGGSTDNPTTTDSIKAIDLGLSVKWGDRNLNASDVFSTGTLCGWGKNGDVLNSSKDEDYAPDLYHAGIPDKTSYSGNPNYDICTYKLGSGWRLPTIEEWQELNNLGQQGNITIENGVFKIKGTNNNYINIPRCGYYQPQTGKTLDSGQKAYYWTGNKAAMIDNAYSITLGIISMNLSSDKMQLHLGIRPVYDK